jgi:NAD(P)H-hydrate epimerase
LTEQKDISADLFRRKKFSHKGTFGHALIFAGSNGKMGASILANKACLRSGSGLLTTLVSEESEAIIQIALPEAMTITHAKSKKLTFNVGLFSGIGMGPGIGQSKESLETFQYLLSKLEKPAVFDADALNLLSENPDLLSQVPKDSIFTPHPKELERLIGKTNDNYSRLYKSQKYAKKHQIYLLIKGAFSVIVTPEGAFHFNNTGNPGMATAGSGDVLTGIITSFLAQGLEAFEALKAGVYIHGLAGDIAKEKHGEASLIASDIIENIGKALLELGV